jgi:hypothetical protein
MYQQKSLSSIIARGYCHQILTAEEARRLKLIWEVESNSRTLKKVITARDGKLYYYDDGSIEIEIEKL